MYKYAILAASLFPLSSAHALAAPNFQGKTITVLVGAPPGTGFDLYGRIFARFLGAHLPGDPAVIVQNMPGAGGLVATNYLYNVAPHDGAVIGVIGQVSAINQVLKKRGVKYDVRKLNWIGRLVSNAQVLMAWRASGIKTIADCSTHRVVVGGTSAASSSVIFPHLMDDFLGTKFKVVSGYKSPPSAITAMERGEIEATSFTWNGVKVKYPDLLRDKKINLIVQFDLKRDSELSKVPTIVELARNQQQARLFEFFASGSVVGYPVVAPPGLTPTVVAVLRKAFDDTTKDPKFIAAAEKERLTLDPLPGAELQTINDDALNVPEKVIAEAKKYGGSGG